MRAPVLLVALALVAGCADLDKLATVIPSPDANGGGIISPNGAGVVAQGAGNVISTGNGGFISTNGAGAGGAPVNTLAPGGAAASTAPGEEPSPTPSPATTPAASR
jgi:hypothetical protein